MALDPDAPRPSLKTPVHVRLSHLPPIPELFKPSIHSIRAGDVGRLIQVLGTGTTRRVVALRAYVLWLLRSIDPSPPYLLTYLLTSPHPPPLTRKQ